MGPEPCEARFDWRGGVTWMVSDGDLVTRHPEVRSRVAVSPLGYLVVAEAGDDEPRS